MMHQPPISSPALPSVSNAATSSSANAGVVSGFDFSRLLDAVFDSDAVLSQAFTMRFKAPAVRRHFAGAPEPVKIEEVNKQLSVHAVIHHTPCTIWHYILIRGCVCTLN